MAGSSDPRARIGAAADAERRTIERALHDGVQQDLIALVVGLQLLRRVSEADVTARLTALDQLEHELHEALDHVRELAERIYPSVLHPRGLADALRSAASKVGVPVRLVAVANRRYPPDIEAAVFFCCREVIENTAVHAGREARAAVHIQDEDGVLKFEIVDEGAGFDPMIRAPGPGLTHVRDRVEALGGELTIESEPGRGTRVAGMIPLYESPSAR